MADKKTSQFTTLTAAQLSDSDYIPVVDVSEPDPALKNKRILVSELKAALGTASGNTTPAAPTMTADDSGDTLDITHALGDAEIEVSVADGTYVALSAVPGWNSGAGKIDVGNVARATGYWKARVKAATGRNASSVASSPAFTVATVSAGTLIVEDNFNAGDTADLAGRSTPTGAKTWERYSSSTGYIGIGDNLGKMFTSGGNGEYRLPVGVRNVDMRITMQGIDGGAWFLMLCFADDNNVIKVGVKTGEVYQYLAGDYGGAPMFAGSGVSAPGDVIRAVLNGTNLTIYRNATKLWDAAENGKSINAALSSTNHGVQSYTDTTSFIDNLQFYTV